MVWTYHDLGTLPIVGTILWCRFPMGGNPNIPGSEHHPVLVLGRKINIEDRCGGLIVAYGTSRTGILSNDTLNVEAEKIRQEPSQGHGSTNV